MFTNNFCNRKRLKKKKNDILVVLKKQYSGVIVHYTLKDKRDIPLLSTRHNLNMRNVERINRRKKRRINIQWHLAKWQQKSFKTHLKITKII